MKKYDPNQAELEVLKFWEDNKIFQKSVENRTGSQEFVWFDGPPFANGLPHFGQSMVTAIKDVVGRYKTMQGFYMPRRMGWDCHGLPVEYEVEKSLGIKNKAQIMEMGIEKFNKLCFESVFKYRKEWETYLARLGRFADHENSYATLDESYMESVWWVFKNLWEKELVYKGFKCVAYCPRCATPLASHEVAQGYKDDVEDASLYVKFAVKDQPQTYLLAWTTTPWTLFSNTALAVLAEGNYLKIKLTSGQFEGEYLILAKDKLRVISEDYLVVEEFKGNSLIGLKYQPLYDEAITKFYLNNKDADSKKIANAYQVYAAEYVDLSDENVGTGIVHSGTPFGEEDLELINQYQLPLINNVDQQGNIISDSPGSGKFVKDAEAEIIAELTKQNKIYSAERIRHTYPFCWRCDSPLIYYSIDTWFIAITKIKNQLLKTNQEINWVPDHIKNGRMGNGLETAPDYAVSRNRFWGTPIPIWYCPDSGEYICIGSLAELKERMINEELPTNLHRPYIDQIKLRTDSGGEAVRIDEVFDCWFESGSMPYGQIHYPFSSDDKSKIQAEFISEGQDQTRGWFYTLHCIATALFGKPAFRNCVVNGMINAADGKKLSKKLRNYTDPAVLISKYGADSLRFYLLSSNASRAESVTFKDEYVANVYRNIITTLHNSASFLSMYAKVDNWDPENFTEPNSNNVLDRWILARLNQTLSIVTEHLDLYDFPKASKPIYQLIDDLSNWYIRRSRRRFWKSENDQDKLLAYQTLFFTLIEIAKLISPFMPFMAEYLYHNLAKNIKDKSASIHLLNWNPGQFNHSKQELIDQMTITREIIEIGLKQRAESGIKVRQPLASAKYWSDERLDFGLEQIIAEELNVKELLWDSGKVLELELDTKITESLRGEGIAKEFIRHIQDCRKLADLAIDDRIDLKIRIGSPEIINLLKTQAEIIAQEVLARQLTIEELTGGIGEVDNLKQDNFDFDREIKIEQSKHQAKIIFSVSE